MEEFKDTKEQKLFFNEVKNGFSDLLVEAFAGCAKTTTAINSLKYVPEGKSKIFLAFNRHIRDELKLKLPNDVKTQTLHGIGYGSIIRKHKDVEIDEFKVDKIINKKKKNWYLHNEFDSEEDINNYLQALKKLVGLCKVTLTTKKQYVPFLCERYGIKYSSDKDVKRVFIILEESMKDVKTIDYNDMVFLPAIDKKYFLIPYDYVYVDEIQDLNRAQQFMIDKIVKKDRKTGKKIGRLILIGDQNQCQPIGTKILMNDGTEKNIQDLKIGDNVVSYDASERGRFVGYHVNAITKEGKIHKHHLNRSPKVEDISKRIYNDKLICIESNGKISKYTPNHKTMVIFDELKKNNYVLYLMQKGDYFKIGITPVYSKSHNRFMTGRPVLEEADKMWILNSYDNKFDAYLDEQYYSLFYSIPQLIFTHRYTTGNYNQKKINDFFDRFDKETLLNNSLKLLNFFNKKYEYPIWIKDEKNYFSKMHMFKIHACNILPNIMKVVHFDEDNIDYRKHGKLKPMKILRQKYLDIDNLWYEDYNDYVYSLKISKFEKYVADGILTHNSIYSFSGVNDKTFDWYREIPNIKKLKLSTTFRCAKKIVEHAQQYVPDIKPLDDAPEGIVRNGDVLNEANNGDFILCRTTMPLVKLFFQFLLKEKKAIIRGSDIGVSLIDMIGDSKTISELKTKWEENLEKYKQKLYTKGIINVNDDSGYTSLEDKVLTLLFIGRLAKDINDLKIKIENIFSDEIEGIVLSTVHKSKGLETDRVFIVRPDLLPMKTVQKPWEAQQEKNLHYVAITRAKLELVYDNEWSDE